MDLTPTQKELISRVTMGAVALGFVAVATWLMVMMIRMGGFDLGRILIPVIVLLYLVAAVFGCFVFSSWDSRRSNIGRTMAIGDKLSDGISSLFEWCWGRGRWW